MAAFRKRLDCAVRNPEQIAGRMSESRDAVTVAGSFVEHRLEPGLNQFAWEELHDIRPPSDCKCAVMRAAPGATRIQLEWTGAHGCRLRRVSKAHKENPDARGEFDETQSLLRQVGRDAACGDAGKIQAHDDLYDRRDVAG